VCVAFFGALFAWYAMQVHQTRFLIEAGFSTGAAALALGLAPFCGIFGQIAIGGFSDRFGREVAWTLAMAGFALAAACFIVLGRYPSEAALYGAVALQGLLGYGAASIYGAIPAELFAGRRFASIFAISTLGGNFGAAAGAWSLGAIHDRTGSYEIGFAVCIGFTLLSTLAVWLAAPRRVRLVAGQARRRAAAG
jgi:MFS family permease